MKVTIRVESPLLADASIELSTPSATADAGGMDDEAAALAREARTATALVGQGADAMQHLLGRFA